MNHGSFWLLLYMCCNKIRISEGVTYLTNGNFVYLQKSKERKEESKGELIITNFIILYFFLHIFYGQINYELDR